MNLESTGLKRRLVTGAGAYVADLAPPGCLHVAFARSYLPSGMIKGVAVEDAASLRGVVATLTPADVRGLGTLPIEGPGHARHEWRVLPEQRVRFVGEPIAAVVAEDPYVAEDGAERIVVDLEPLPPVMTIAAASTDESVVNPEAETNVLFSAERDAGDPDTAFASAALVVERTFTHGRQTPLPLETRGVVAAVEPGSGSLVVWTSTQVPHMVRTAIASCLGRREDQVRVVTPNVGGGFGLKATVFPEEVLVAHLASELGRPVRWIEDRRENLIASTHAHDERIECRLAMDAHGAILGLEVDVAADVGAFASYPFTASLEPLTTSAFVLAGYRVPALRLRARGIATNKCPTGPYRGVGIPPGVFAGESLLDIAADELGLDRIDVRRANLVTPDELPYRTPLGVTWDTGDYPAAFDQALARADYAGLMAERERRRDDSTVLGVGVTFFNEHSGPGSAAYRGRGVATIPGYDSARVTVDHEGAVRVYASSADAGQNHAEAVIGSVATELQIPPEDISFLEGDTASCPPGSGTFASRFSSAQLSACVEAARRVRSRMCAVAAILLDVRPEDVEVTSGGFTTAVSGSSVRFDEVARAANLRTPDFVAPAGFEPGLDVNATFDLSVPTYPYGAHVAAVELDRETFAVRLVSYVGVEDCGTVVDEASVHEQILGAVAMGLGNALFEEHLYDEFGQIKTATLMDYLVPLATSMTHMELHQLESPTERTPLGTKGVGEAGTIGAVGAIGTAVADAVRVLGGELLSLPASPARLFAAIAKSRTTSVG